MTAFPDREGAPDWCDLVSESRETLWLSGVLLERAVPGLVSSLCMRFVEVGVWSLLSSQIEASERPCKPWAADIPEWTESAVEGKPKVSMQS